jgi:hypothetical protein
VEEIVKVILDYGIAGGALVVLSYVNVQQMKLMYKMEERQTRVEELSRINSDKIDLVVDKVDKSFRLNEAAVDSINQCRAKNQLPHKSR